MDRSIFDTVEGQSVPNNEKPSLLGTVVNDNAQYKAPELLGSITQGKERLITDNPQAAGRFGLGESVHDWGIKDENLLDLQEIRAAHQTPGEQFLAFANQATVGQIVGSGIEGLGYMLDLKSWANLLTGTEKDFGNWFSDIGKRLNTWTEEATPIYTDPRQGKFAPGHWSWWMENGKSVTSTLSLMIPAAGIWKGISKAGEAVKFWEGMAPVIKAIKPAEMTMEKAVSLGKWATTGLGEAAISRHMESMQNAAGVYKEAYQAGIGKGMSDTDAKDYAARSAAHDYKLEWSMYLQDVPQYLLLNTAFGKGVGKTAGLAEKSVMKASMMGEKVLPIIKSKAGVIGLDMLGEGFEEGYQYIIQEESKYLEDKLRDPKSNNSFDDRLHKYLQSGDFWTNAAMGALGAGVMQTAGKAINNMIQGGDPSVRFVKDFTTKIGHAAQAVQFADLLGSESAKRSAVSNLENTLFTHAMATDSMDDAKELIKRTANPNDPLLQKLGVSQDDLDVLKLNHIEILQHADEFKNLWDKNAKLYEGEKLAKVTNSQFLIDQFNKYKQDYSTRLDAIKPQITNFHELSYEAQDMFSVSSQILANQKRIDFQQKRLDDTKNPLNAQQKIQAQKLIDMTEKSNSRLKADLISLDKSRDEETKKADDALNIGGPYNLLNTNEVQKTAIEKSRTEEINKLTPEDQAKKDITDPIHKKYDDQIKDLPKSNDITNHSILEYNKLNEALGFADDTLKTAQQNLNDILRDKNQPQPKPPDAEDLTNVPDSDDYVLFTKDGKQYPGIVDYVNAQGDYVIVPTTKWSEQSQYASKPTGDPVIVSKDNVVLDKKQYAEEDIVDESLSDSDIPNQILNEDEISDKYLDVSYMYDSGEGKVPTVTNDDLHRFLVDPKSSFDGITAEMHVDTQSTYGVELLKAAGLTDIEIRRIKKGKLTDNDINELFTHMSVDTVPISIVLVKDGKVLFKGGMFYHTTDFTATHIPDYIKAQGTERVKRYINDQKQKIRANRFTILKNVLKGNTVYSDTLRRTNGHYNNSDTRGNVLTRHGLSISDGRLAVSRRNGKIYSSNNNIIPNVNTKTAGNIFAPTKKTITGKEAWAKVNPTKLTREHADILWDAIVTRYSKGRGRLATLEGDDRVSGLNVGEIINLLTLFGEKKTNLDYVNNKTGAKFQGEQREDLRKKTLYVKHEQGTKLTFGTTTINLFEDNIDAHMANKEAFIKWATANKNYSIPLSNKSMGLNLNQPFNRTFTLGAWENKADEKGNFLTMAQILMSTPVDGKKQFAVESDLQEYENTGSAFVRPSLLLGDNNYAIKVIVNQTAKPKTPKETTKSKARKEAVKRASNKPISVDSPMDLKDLPVGAELYYNDPIIVEQVDTGETQKRTIVTVEFDRTNGRQLNLRKLQTNEIATKFGQYLMLDHPDSFAALDQFVSALKRLTSLGKIYIDVSGVVEEKNIYEVKPSQIRYESLDPIDVIEIKREEALRKEFGKDTDSIIKNINTLTERSDENAKKIVDKFDEINAKYDAELEQLKTVAPETTTNETSEDALKDILGIGMSIEFSSPVKSVIDIGKELKWLNDRFGMLNVQESNKLLTLASDGRKAFSVFTSDCIYVFTGAPEGALYHEAFHRVTLGYLSLSDRQKVFESARKMFNMPKVTNSEISERLAEDFRAYKLNKTQPKSRTIWQFFKDLYNFIYTFFTGKTRLTSNDIARLYDSIDRGQFKYSKITAENNKLLSNIETPMAIEIRKTPISFINNYNDLDKIVKFLTGVLITTNEIDDLNDIKNIQMSKMWDHVDKMLTRLNTAITNDHKKLDDKLIPAEQLDKFNSALQVSTNLYNLLTAVRSKDFSKLFVDKITDMLAKLNVKRIESEDIELDDLTDNNYRQYYDRASYEVNSKDNLLASVKFLIATLPKNGQMDPNIGISEFVDFNQMWNSLMHNLYDISNVEEMMDRLKEYEDQHPYKVLIQKLEQDLTGNKKEQLRAAVQKHRHNFVNFLLTLGKEGSAPKIEITKADVASASRLSIKEWNFRFYGSNLLTRTNKQVSINADLAAAIFADYEKLAKKIEKQYSNTKIIEDKEGVIAVLTSLLNRVGINVDEDSVTDMVNNRIADNSDDQLLQVISADFSHIFTKIRDASTYESTELRKMFDNDRALRSLAESDANTHPEKISDIILGPSNHQYFVYAQNSHVSDTVRKIRNDEEYLTEHLNKIYNDNSYYGQQMLDNPEVRKGLEIMTFAMFGKRGTAGEDYLNINPIEDYLFKLSAMATGYIPFPTMADRGTYYLLKGITPYKFKYVPNGPGKYVIPEEALNILLGYAKSERSRIVEAQRVIDEYNDAKKEGNVERIKQLEHGLVEGYHYKIVGGEKNTSKDNAGALRYHNFPSFNREGFDFDSMARDEIKKAITENVRQELAYLEDLGIIGSTFDVTANKTRYYNRLIPNAANNSSVDLLAEGVADYGSADMAIRNLVASHFINTVIANTESEKLFSGDPAFFKQDKDTKRVIEDKVKRLSVLTSTGDNFADKTNDELNADFNIVTIGTQKYQSINYEALETWYVASQKRRLKAENPDISAEELDAKAKSTTADILKPYRDMDPTDGQAWIKPDMYRSLSRRLGEWSDNKNEAFELIQSGRELTLEEEQKVLNVTFQPLKLVYFTLLHDGNLAIPTFHKASFATIFRTMTKGAYGERQIGDMLDRMEGKGKYQDSKLKPVDMFMMDSATKVGNRNKFNVLDDKLENFNDLSNIDVYQQPFSGLRRQLITDSHDVDRTKTGTQFLKIVLGNMMLNDKVYSLNGQNVDGKYIRDTAFQSLTALSNRAKSRLEEKLGYTNGKLDKSKLIEMLAEDAKKSNASDNLIDAISMLGDDMYIELDALTDRKWIQSRIISMISKRTIDVELPGNQLIQFANFGVRSINKQYTFEEELSAKDKHIAWVKKGTDDLQWMKLENGKVIPMGCIVSINLFKHVIPNYDNITYKEKVNYLRENPDIMGYRIPTQGQNSIFMMQVAGIYPETVGDTITFPSEFTALTGSDFDIDKAYVVRHNYYVDHRDNTFEKIKFLEGNTSDPKFLTKIYNNNYQKILRTWSFLNEGGLKEDDFTKEQKEALEQMRDLSDDERVSTLAGKLLDYNRRVSQWWNEINDILKHYNLEKFIEENKGKSLYDLNSAKAVQNRLIDSFFAVMRSEAHYQLTSAPLDGLTAKLKDKAKEIRKLSETEKPNMYYQSPRFNEDIKWTYNGGKDGIGPFALNNVHHVLAQLSNLQMRGTFGDVMQKSEDGKNIDLSRQFGKDGIYISNWLSALIDAHVDVAKDPYIMDLNVNSYTYNVVALLIRGGVGETTFDFMAQPILRELARNTILSDKNSTLRKELTIEDGLDDENQPKYRKVNAEQYVTRKWASKLTNAEVETVNGLNANDAFGSHLTSDLSQKDLEDKEFIKRQLLVLRAFTDLLKMGKNLNTLVQASQIDTKKFGSNITELRVFLNKIRAAYATKAFVNIENILPYNPDTGQIHKEPEANHLGTYAANAIKFSLDILGDISIYASPVFNEIFDKIINVSGNQFTIDSKFVNLLSDELFSTIASKYFTDPNGPIKIDSAKLSTLMDRVAEKLYKLKEDTKFADLKDNAFLKYLYLYPSEDPLLPFDMFIAVPMKSVKDKIDKDNMINSFKELLKDPRKEVRDLARQLYYYAFFTSGYRSRIYSFFNLIPNEISRELQLKDTTSSTGYSTVLEKDNYNTFIKKTLNEMKNIMNVYAYKSLIDEVLINNHDHENLIKFVEDRNIETIIPNFKNKESKYPAAIVLKGYSAKYYQIGQNEDKNPVFRPYVKIHNEELGHILLKYIGYLTTSVDTKTEIHPVYVSQNMRSYNSRGVVIKETNMDKSIIEEYNKINSVTESEEEIFLNDLSLKENIYETGAEPTYMPKEDQIVITPMHEITPDDENDNEQTNTQTNETENNIAEMQDKNQRERQRLSDNPASDKYYQREIQLKSEVRIGEHDYNIKELIKIADIFNEPYVSNEMISVEKSASRQKEFDGWSLGEYYDESEVSNKEDTWIMANKELAKNLFQDWYDGVVYLNDEATDTSDENYIDLSDSFSTVGGLIDGVLQAKYNEIYKIVDIRQLSLFDVAKDVTDEQAEERKLDCL